MNSIQLGDAIRSLKQVESWKDYREELEHIAFLFNGIEDSYILDLLSWEEYQREMQTLAKKLSRIIEKSGDQPVLTISERESNDTPILVVTPFERRIEELEQFFKKFGFPNVKGCLWEKHPGLDNYKIVVFDNTDLYGQKDMEKLPERIKKRASDALQDRIISMESCIESSRVYLLHYGNNLDWVSTKRKRAHAANSKFALYARLKELVDFIKAYEV